MSPASKLLLFHTYPYHPNLIFFCLLLECSLQIFVDWLMVSCAQLTHPGYSVHRTDFKVVDLYASYMRGIYSCGVCIFIASFCLLPISVLIPFCSTISQNIRLEGRNREEIIEPFFDTHNIYRFCVHTVCRERCLFIYYIQKDGTT